MNSIILTQEQYSDLRKYAIPESDMVKLVYEDMVEKEISDWEKEVTDLVNGSLNGDKESLFNLLELIYTNAFNEGELNYASEQKAG